MADMRGEPNGKGQRYAIVISRFNEVVTEQLLAGARECLAKYSVDADDVDVYSVPGAWELPIAAQTAARRQRYSAIVALGCVIRGETPHFDFVAGEASAGLARVSLKEKIPIGFGLLTTETLEQAMARAGGKGGNKGWDAALAALEMADLLQQGG